LRDKIIVLHLHCTTTIVQWFVLTIKTKAMIKINKLTFAYKKQNELFKSLTLAEESGRIIGLLGKNGAGKTTLLQLITGLLTPKTGEIEILGYNPAERNPSFLEKVYYVPEEFQLPNIVMQAYIKATAALYPNFDLDKMARLVKEFELDPKCNLMRISHGQKKKFRIAFALATNCELIILDEPTNGLDIPSKAIFRRTMAGSLADNQLIIISTHQVKDIEALIDKIIVIDNGTVVFNNNVLDIADKFEFRVVPSLSNAEIYSEQAYAGHKVIVEATGASTEIDMELLFNAVCSGAKFN